MSRNNWMRLCIIVIFLLFMQNSFGAEKSALSYVEDVRDLALQECLDINYIKLGAYKRKDLRDSSLFLYPYGYEERYGPIQLHALTEFIEKEAGHFYKERLPLKYEEDNTSKNGVFARCMAFYKSKELKRQIIKILKNN